MNILLVLLHRYRYRYSIAKDRNLQVHKRFSQRSNENAQECILNWKQNFADIPETKVRLGSSLDSNTIREGTDVYFDCLVSAHPHVYKVEWRHNVNTTIKY